MILAGLHEDSVPKGIRNASVSAPAIVHRSATRPLRLLAEGLSFDAMLAQSYRKSVRASSGIRSWFDTPRTNRVLYLVNCIPYILSLSDIMADSAHGEILERVSMDLLSIPQLIFRSVRKRITLTTLSEVDMNITPLHVEIIRVLEEEGTLHASEIGERLQIARAQMTKLIDRLVSLNIVERKMDLSDRRTYNISLTTESKTILRRHHRKVVRAVQEIVSSLSDDELDHLSLSLRRLRDVLVESADGTLAPVR